MDFFYSLGIFTQVLVFVSSGALLILLFYYLVVFTKTLKSNNQVIDTKTPVSVIIAAKNELKNLEKFLPTVLTQKHSDYEVIVVNDSSWDGTSDWLKEQCLHYPNLKVVTLDIDERYQKGKKFALTMGIKAAKNEYLLFTDADCEPSSDEWISKMLGSLTAHNDTEIVLGNSPLLVKNNILGSVISYETFHTAVQYMSYANAGIPYMGVGRNMGYTKSLFFKNKGFASHQHILSGDDDLFIQQVATAKNISVCASEGSNTRSAAPAGIKAWIKQKNRHMSTSSEYKNKFKFLLGLYSFAQLLFYTAVVLILIVNTQNWIIALTLVGIKWIVQWAVLFAPAKTLKYGKISWALPYYDILYTFYLLLFALIKPFSKTKSWS